MIERGIADADDATRVATRRGRSRPVLDAIRAKLDELLPVTPPKSGLGVTGHPKTSHPRAVKTSHLRAPQNQPLGLVHR